MTKKRKNAVCCSGTVFGFDLFSFCYINSQLFPTVSFLFMECSCEVVTSFLISAVTIHYASLKECFYLDVFIFGWSCASFDKLWKSVGVRKDSFMLWLLWMLLSYVLGCSASLFPKQGLQLENSSSAVPQKLTVVFWIKWDLQDPRIPSVVTFS